MRKQGFPRGWDEKRVREVLEHYEAQSAESRRDFVHKIKISLKELCETRVWLLIIRRKGLVKRREKLDAVLAECDELISIFVASVRTAQKNDSR